MKYDFKCPKCGHIAEVEMSLKEYENLEKVLCSECQSEMKRTYTKLANFTMEKKE